MRTYLHASAEANDYRVRKQHQRRGWSEIPLPPTYYLLYIYTCLFFLTIRWVASAGNLNGCVHVLLFTFSNYSSFSCAPTTEEEAPPPHSVWWRGIKKRHGAQGKILCLLLFLCFSAVSRSIPAPAVSAIKERNAVLSLCISSQQTSGGRCRGYTDTFSQPALTELQQCCQPGIFNAFFGKIGIF